MSVHPGLALRDALLGRGPARLLGPWVEIEGHLWHGFARHDPTGHKVASVTISVKSHQRWALDMAPDARSEVRRLPDPSTGRGWLTETGAMDHADRELARAGWELLDMEQMEDR